MIVKMRCDKITTGRSSFEYTFNRLQKDTKEVVRSFDGYLVIIEDVEGIFKIDEVITVTIDKETTNG